MLFQDVSLAIAVVVECGVTVWCLALELWCSMVLPLVVVELFVVDCCESAEI